MTAAKKAKLADILRGPGIREVKQSEIPPISRGRMALVPQLTVAKKLEEAFRLVSEEGISPFEAPFEFDMSDPSVQKEATEKGLKHVASSFFHWARGRLSDYQLTKKLTLVRREKGKRIFLVDMETAHKL